MCAAAEMCTAAAKICTAPAEMPAAASEVPPATAKMRAATATAVSAPTTATASAVLGQGAERKSQRQHNYCQVSYCSGHFLTLHSTDVAPRLDFSTLMDGDRSSH
jgi:hypothetical protein